MAVEFRNESANKFVDISSEQYRVYTFAEASVKIDNPQQLSVSAGGHRLFDGQGNSWYIPKGWISLSWKAREGQPHFVK
jgi:hypothetical protein